MVAIKVGEVAACGATNKVVRCENGSYLIKCVSMFCNRSRLPRARSRMLRKPLDNTLAPKCRGTSKVDLDATNPGSPTFHVGPDTDLNGIYDQLSWACTFPCRGPITCHEHKAPAGTHFDR
jgi:hypothetical protein